jgi:Raf kinase inhibitor-like YbhB/YbcL family protein
MKKIILGLSILLTNTAFAQTFTLQSKDLGGQATMQQVFNGFGCTGENKSPQLSWTNAPKSTKSFAITMYDESAPTGSGWWHWLAFDIPSTTSEIVQQAGNTALNLLPKGSIQSKTDYGSFGYGGPCPPEGHGFHKYTITVYALDIDKLGLDKETNAAVVGFYLNQHTIEKSSLVFYYKR